MTKSARKKTSGAVPAKGAEKAKKALKTAKGQTKAAEYVGNLLELHKLQGVLLGRLRREI
jgi:hypothetical protein